MARSPDAIVYISVSYEESIRRNEARYQASLAHSILAHKLPDESQKRFSKEQDFHDLTGNQDRGYLDVKGVSVPFVVIRNEPRDGGADPGAEKAEVPASHRCRDPNADVMVLYRLRVAAPSLTRL